MDERALNIVRQYIEEHLDKSDKKPQFEVFIVWKAKVLQNWKYLISSTLYDGMYYELTYNGDRNEWYLDAYKKFENRVVPITEQTENSSEIPNNCETCRHYTLACDLFSEICNYEPKDEPTGYNLTPVEDEPQTCSFSDCDNFKNPDYERCIECKRKQIKLKTEQTERSE